MKIRYIPLIVALVFAPSGCEEVQARLHNAGVVAVQEAPELGKEILKNPSPAGAGEALLEYLWKVGAALFVTGGTGYLGMKQVQRRRKKKAAEAPTVEGLL